MENKSQKRRDRQLCIIPGWMLRFGFSPWSLIDLAIIHGFTESCGGFIYDPLMLCEWTGDDPEGVKATVLDLAEKGLIEVISTNAVTVIRSVNDLKTKAMNYEIKEEL